MTHRLHDDQLDREIRTFLALQAEDVAGAPSAAEMAIRVSSHAGTRMIGPRLAPELVWVVLAVLLVATLVVAAAGAILRDRNRLVEEAPGSPSNGWIAYSTRAHEATTGVPGEIYVVREGTEPRLVGGGDGAITICPSFSPDGTRLSYVHGDEVRILGGDPAATLHEEAHASVRGRLSCPVWSPTSELLATLTPDGIILIRLDGTTATLPVPEAQPVEVAYSPVSWSPDGGTLAVATRWGIWLVYVDGSFPRTHTTTPASPSSLSWSPDGSHLAIEEVREGSIGDVSVLTFGTDALPVALGTGRHPVWSPAGDSLAYQSMAGLVIVRADGSDRRAAGVGNAYGFGGWSPDGSRVLQMVDVSGVDFAVFSGSAFDGSYTVISPKIPTGSFRNFPNLGDVSWQAVYE
jgi:Tol biopolymer transport system component